MTLRFESHLSVSWGGRKLTAKTQRSQRFFDSLRSLRLCGELPCRTLFVSQCDPVPQIQPIDRVSVVPHHHGQAKDIFGVCRGRPVFRFPRAFLFCENFSRVCVRGDDFQNLAEPRRVGWKQVGGFSPQRRKDRKDFIKKLRALCVFAVNSGSGCPVPGVRSRQRERE